MKAIYQTIIILLAMFTSHMVMASAESITVNDITLALDNQQCKVSSIRQPVRYLEIRPECHFVRDEKSQKIHIEKIAAQRYVVLVVGSPVIKQPRHPITMTRHDCGSQLKAVIVDGERITVSKNALTSKLFCAGLGVDREYYQVLGK